MVGAKHDPSLGLFELVFRPGTYAGYQRHVGSDEILLVVSGKAENYHSGGRCIVEPGEAILTKSGQAHAIRNASDEDLTVLGVFAPLRALGSVENLPLPDETSGWV
jgi:quercetin dioxygenase-like cupin family protein